MNIIITIKDKQNQFRDKFNRYPTNVNIPYTIMDKLAEELNTNLDIIDINKTFPLLGMTATISDYKDLKVCGIVHQGHMSHNGIIIEV